MEKGTVIASVSTNGHAVNGKNVVNGDSGKKKTRYSDEELLEFKVLILQKLEIAHFDLKDRKSSLTQSDGNDIHDTSPTFKILEEGNETMSKEQMGKEVVRIKKFISNLDAALVRIENKTYGICRDTGALISRERLRAVPHATLSIEAKMEMA